MPDNTDTRCLMADVENEMALRNGPTSPSTTDTVAEARGDVMDAVALWLDNAEVTDDERAGTFEASRLERGVLDSLRSYEAAIVARERERYEGRIRGLEAANSRFIAALAALDKETK